VPRNHWAKRALAPFSWDIDKSERQRIYEPAGSCGSAIEGMANNTKDSENMEANVRQHEKRAICSGGFVDLSIAVRIFLS